ncbi:amino acid transporter, AAAP family [Galdieria sulphuraria]|uniref:Amino acid transporter, AAAP family n=1 Tax=Galdieria sulphuraria TaxID=130081 RepID=M2XDA2_GALSU|nr:amino acid transporter, AAAP family [Galdieria sulphuraria]EME27927.1 amino acid transporter, AAAP family [Galdieria sulphuraria]|eukprot:XP_005704447.1 amino acid transporter, AAAP family [Galdieria sulphuraria]
MVPLEEQKEDRENIPSLELASCDELKENYLLDGTLRRPHLSWWRCVFLILGDIMGAGILAIPYALATMGWLLGILFLVLMCLVYVYCGILLYRMRLMIPQIRTYGDLGEQVYGTIGRWAVYIVQYSNLFLFLPVYLLVSSKALRETVNPDSCLIIWMFVNSGILIFFMQTRTLRFISWYSLFGTICICVTLVITVIQEAKDAISSTSHGQLISSGGLERGIAGSGDIIFAYSGIFVFIEFMDEMRKPKDFWKAIYTANGILFFFYTFVGVLGYAVYGKSVVNPITSALSAGLLKRVANAFLWLHILAAFVIHGLILNRAIALRLCKHYVDDFSIIGMLAWFCITLCTTGLVLLLNIFFPYLSDVESLSGTLFSPLTGFLFPNLFYWKCKGSTMSWKEKMVGCVILVVLGIAYTVIGTYGTIYSIVQDASRTPLLYKCLYS